MQIREHELFGLKVAAISRAEAVSECERAVSTNSSVMLGVVNAAKVVKLRDDPELAESLAKCDLILADGQSVVWASRILGKPLPERVAGIDLFTALLELADQKQLRVYLLGATPAVLAAVCREIHERWPRAEIAGAHHGYFSAEDEGTIVDDIIAAHPDLLFLGITSPIKELFIGRHGQKMRVPVVHGVGGSFDVLAGKTKRAPKICQDLGLEWAYRVVQEPRRLAPRYMSTNTRFLALVAREYWKSHSGKGDVRS
ncbi:MAG: WecB/TagA/CpsF family glycosyltransferase [Actinobacteria bacterium]|nr:WecB/TagA/CpsF family glycosyltransferase [Actinomycetota bacterium]